MKIIIQVSNTAIKALVTVGLLFSLLLSSSAQEYYYSKAAKYMDRGWKESAVQELNNGVRAGEKKCILPLAYCYIKEIGTPRNLVKAESLLQSGAQSDPVTCFIASYIYDGGSLGGYELRQSYHYYLYDLGVYIYNFARSYDEEMIIPANPTKALKYARQYHKLENSEKSQRWKDYIEFKCYLYGLGGVSQNIEKALEIKREYGDAAGFSIEEYMNYMLQFSESLRDLGDIVNFMQMSGNLAWIDYQDPEYYYSLISSSYSARDYNVQFLGLFDDLYAEWVAGLETEQQRKVKYESANLLEKTAINIGLAFKSHQLGYIKVDESNSNSRIVDLENLISLSPSDSVTKVARIAWTRLKVAELLKKPSYYGQQLEKCVKRSDVRELFSHPYYAEVKGYDRYFLEKNRDTWYSNSDAIKVFITTQKSDIIQSLKEMDLLDLSDFKIDNITRYNLSDYKNDLQVLIEDNKIMFGLFDNIISKAQANIRDMEAFLKFLSDEKASKVSIDDYLRLQSNSISECRTYVTNRLNKFAAERRQIESDVENFKHISAEDYALYQKFQIIAQDGKFKKIKAEEVQRLLTDVLYPSIELCEKAIEVYPRPNTSEILKSLYEQQDICLLLTNYFAGTLKVSDCDTVAKYYNSSDYSLLISNLKAAQEKLDRSKK